MMEFAFPALSGLKQIGCLTQTKAAEAKFDATSWLSEGIYLLLTVRTQPERDGLRLVIVRPHSTARYVETYLQ